MNLLSEINTDPQMLIDLLWNQAAIWGPKLLLSALTLIIGWRVARLLGSLLEKGLDRRHIDPTLKPFLTSVLTMIVKAGVVVTAISTAGIQATSFAALFASAGLAIGLALSGTLQNFAGGVILLIVRPFKVGDVIEVQGFIGTVNKIEIFQTILLTGDNKMIHIPNGKLQNDSIINYSAMPDRRVDFSFGIGYNDDIDTARDVIAGVVKGIPEISDTPGPQIVVGQLADSSVNLTVRVWTKTPDYWRVHFAMNEQVKKALDAAGISIPFPQRDIHVFQESPAQRAL
ncbi:mechanosensitive ion channel domain-containing protein [Verrucomicrobiaceae bacterium 227]